LTYKSIFELFPHCMECQQGLSDEKAVCVSVCQSVCTSVCLFDKRADCNKMDERSFQIFKPYERPFSLVFCEEAWLVGRPLLLETLGQTGPVGAKSPIFSRYSLVAPQP